MGFQVKVGRNERTCARQRTLRNKGIHEEYNIEIQGRGHERRRFITSMNSALSDDGFTRGFLPDSIRQKLFFPPPRICTKSSYYTRHARHTHTHTQHTHIYTHIHTFTQIYHRECTHKIVLLPVTFCFEQGGEIKKRKRKNGALRNFQKKTKMAE